MPIRVGDWVCFERNHQLCIAAVRYIRPAGYWPHPDLLETDLGTVDSTRVLEVRSVLNPGVTPGAKEPTGT